MRCMEDSTNDQDSALSAFLNFISDVKTENRSYDSIRLARSLPEKLYTMDLTSKLYQLFICNCAYALEIHMALYVRYCITTTESAIAHTSENFCSLSLTFKLTGYLLTQMICYKNFCII